MAASNGFQSSSYANERPPSSQGSAAGDGDVASDPASSSFFMNDYKKHDDLKQMLDSNKDALKLEAMKRIIGMVAKGKDACDLFPAVVKNVVSKNIEVKKLVYVYLTRYAEEQQDLALLSISTFQRALKDPNQLIRASALRVLSSIRVPMIVPIMMLAIKESTMDMSPYVRKTAAHAIPKLYSLDPEQKDQLIEVIEKLLGDKTTLVAGSSIQAFEEVCPERIDLIHKNYRKLCNLLVDVDEWGQVAIIIMLTRYCRLQFVNPNKEDETAGDSDKNFYESSDDSDKEDKSSTAGTPKKKMYVMDADHRLLLRNTKPLLNSRNGAVVMAVAQLYHHCAPKSEVNLVSKALIRLLRGNKEVQYVVLCNIASMSVHRNGMFEPYLKSFYVRSNDATQAKLLKLEILTNLATETNISTILREFQTYVTSSDQEFAAATIQAIGRCASNIPEIADTCLSGLVSLLANRNEAVVGESVVIIKKLLQMQSSEHSDIITHLARLSDTITVPLARASILWLIGEYSDRVPKIAPDVLRKMAKSFIEEEDIVKLQILNLAAKLCISNPKQTKLLCQYVFNLAKYDQNYDIRDRSRFLRALILPSESTNGSQGHLAKHAKKIFLTTKPAPVLQSKFKDNDQYQLGTLSHVINTAANGYQEIPDWPAEAPDTSVRDVEPATTWGVASSGKKSASKASSQEKKKKSFYSDEDSSSGSGTTEGADSTSSSTESSSSSSSSSSDSSASSSSSSNSQDSDGDQKKRRTPNRKKKRSKSDVADPLTGDLLSGGDVAMTPPDPIAKQSAPHINETSDDSGTSSGSSSGSESDSEQSSSAEEEVKDKKVINKKAEKPVKKKEEVKTEKKSASAMLLDLDDFGPPSQAPVMLPGDLMSPSQPAIVKETKPQPNYTNVMSAPFIPQTEHELLNKYSGNGVSATYRFTRTMSIFSPKMTSVEIVFTNHGDKPVENIRMGTKKNQTGISIQEFPEVATLAPNVTTSSLMAIDFNDTTQPAQFEIVLHNKKQNVQITAPVGELLVHESLSETDFLTKQGKLAGMNENTANVTLAKSDSTSICRAVAKAANVLQVPSSADNVYYFAGKTVSSGAPALVSVKVTGAEEKAKLTVNCDSIVIGNMLLRDIKQMLTSG